MNHVNKTAVGVAAPNSGNGGLIEEISLRFSDTPQCHYIRRFARNQDEAEAFTELFRLGFNESETDAVMVHGFLSTQFYQAVLDLLCTNEADEANVRKVFKNRMPELFVIGGCDVRPE